jgi:hypothetical protein
MGTDVKIPPKKTFRCASGVMPKLLAGSQQNAFLKSGAKILWSVKSFVETPKVTQPTKRHILPLVLVMLTHL